jgi:multicomponent Na+:H+ antiporter subunit A
LLLGALGLGAGLLPQGVAHWLVTPAVGSILGQNPAAMEPVKLELWHGFTPALALSLGSVLLGLGVYAAWPWVRMANGRLGILLNHGPEWWYQLALDGLNRLAQAQTRLLQNGYLRFYVMTILMTTVVLAGYTLGSRSEMAVSWNLRGVRPYEAALAALILAAAVATARMKARLAAVAALGVVGYSVALVFILFGAPDLAMTQFMIETLTVILFVLVLYRLPTFVTLSSNRERIRDMLVAGLTGTLVAAMVLVAIHIPDRKTISGFFVENSVSEAHGRNVVNVILVDFRGFDTLGEITVLATAAVGIYGLLRLALKPGDDGR